MPTIIKISTSVKEFPLKEGDGTDSIHTDPVYSYAVTHLHTDSQVDGTGIVFTIGAGNREICSLIEGMASSLVGCEIEELMSQFGVKFRQMADHPQYRWLGPHKGMVHLALASITNACYDLWAKVRGVPLWRLLLDLSPEQIVNTLDLGYLEEVLTHEDALALLTDNQSSRLDREGVIESGYPGYDTSIGWFNYSDEQVRENVKKAVAAGFTAMKLKVGSPNTERDIRRAYLVREGAGDDARVMLDVNQSWTLPNAISTSKALAGMSPFWIEEPTQPDDVIAHQTLAREIAPIDIALGEHVSNRVMFKNFMQAEAVKFVQVDCTRVGGISEFITVSLLARKFGLPVVPHVGDMGQIHQHLVLFNHIALGHEALFLEHIPHLREYFLHPAMVSDGIYKTPQEPGSSSDFV
ncbi:MAG: mandelate racemase [Verrucomicrobia bacterium]|nr:mandelate racemase [Verrucomicrobiota bacterium]